MGQILKFPAPASKFGYTRVKKRARCADHPNQLTLFPPQTAQILPLTPALGAFEQALLLDERGDDRAVEFYERAIADSDCVADAYCNLGILESQKGRRAKAFDCFTASLKNDPRHSEAHYNLANLYFEVNDFRLAQFHYEMAAEVDPEFANVHFNLALVQSINNEFAAAIATLTRYQQLVPADEARNAEELLQTFRKSLAAANNPRFSST
jgi:tetratricopeptide (TPR) repeat protein